MESKLSANRKQRRLMMGDAKEPKRNHNIRDKALKDSVLELEVARKAERQASKKVKQLEIEKRVAVKEMMAGYKIIRELKERIDELEAELEVQPGRADELESALQDKQVLSRTIEEMGDQITIADERCERLSDKLHDCREEAMKAHALMSCKDQLIKELQLVLVGHLRGTEQKVDDIVGRILHPTMCICGKG